MLYVRLLTQKEFTLKRSWIALRPWFQETHEGSRLFDTDSPMTAELRKVIEDRFAYRFEEVELAELLKSEAAGSSPVAPVDYGELTPARIQIARSTRNQQSK